MEPVYGSVIRTILTTFALQRWTVRTTGGQHVPESGGAIVATNHIGYLDFIMAGYSVRQSTQRKRLVRFAAKKEVFDHALSGPLMRAMKHIPVDRGGAAHLTLERAEELLRGGELVGMFPEATISRSFVPLPGKSGTVRMAQRAGVPILPAAIWGSQRIYTKGRPANWTKRNVLITVDWAPPMVVGPDDDPQEATDRLMATLTELADHAARTYPVEPDGPDDDWWVPAHLGGGAPTPEEAAAMARAEAAERRAARRAQLRGEEP